MTPEVTEGSNAASHSEDDLACLFLEEYLSPALQNNFTLHAAQLSALNALQPILSNSKLPVLYLLTCNFDRTAKYRNLVDAKTVLRSVSFDHAPKGFSQKESCLKKRYDVFGRKLRGDRDRKQIVDFSKTRLFNNDEQYSPQWPAAQNSYQFQHSLDQANVAVLESLTISDGENLQEMSPRPP